MLASYVVCIGIPFGIPDSTMSKEYLSSEEAQAVAEAYRRLGCEVKVWKETVEIEDIPSEGIYRVYSDDGGIALQSKDMKEAVEYAKARTLKDTDVVETVWYLDPADDCMVDGQGIINEQAVKVCEIFQGEVMMI